MKRMIAVLITAILLLCGCTAKRNLPPVPDLNFNAEINVIYRQYKFSGTVQNTLNGPCIISVTEPEMLSGLQVIVNNGVCSLKLGSLSYDIDKNSFPQTDFMKSFVTALTDSLSTSEFQKNEDGSYTLKGNTEVGDYELLLSGETGYPMSLKIKDIDFFAEFKCVKSNSN